MLSKIRDLILRVSYPLLKALSDLYAPWAKKQIEVSHVEDLLSKAIPGDILISQTWGAATNLFIPGKWKHVAVYSRDHHIVEAVDPDVRETSIWQFAMTKDRIALLRYRHFNEEQLAKVATNAQKQIGLPYDYGFKLPQISQKNTAFYCSELAYWCHWMVDNDMKFKLRETWGQPTVVADDYIAAKDHWELIWTSH